MKQLLFEGDQMLVVKISRRKHRQLRLLIDKKPELKAKRIWLYVNFQLRR